jgi:hypothetical protein
VNRRICGVAAPVLLLVCVTLPASAQEGRGLFVGALVGVSTLQADGQSVTSPSDAALSLYKPENGLALNLFGGWHLAEYFSVQANWMWNRNDLALVASTTAAPGGAFYEQHRRSHQSAIDVDGVIYFRRRDSAVRPYLGTGLLVFWFSSGEIVSATSRGLDPPQGEIASVHIGLRSHVGIDIALAGRLRFRYSFSETISSNPISPSLTPPGERRLANFQNLFGIVREF